MLSHEVAELLAGDLEVAQLPGDALHLHKVLTPCELPLEVIAYCHHPICCKLQWVSGLLQRNPEQMLRRLGRMLSMTLNGVPLAGAFGLQLRNPLCWGSALLAGRQCAGQQRQCRPRQPGGRKGAGSSGRPA